MESKTVAWYRPGAIGDVMMTANLLKRFRAMHPDEYVTYWCSKTTADIMYHFLFAAGFDGIALENPNLKTYNLIGYPIPNNPKNPGKHPYERMKKHLIEYFADDLEVEPDFDSLLLRRPNFDIKGDYITLQHTAGWSPYKNWSLENWNKLCFELSKRKIPVVQIGGPNDARLPHAMACVSGPAPNLQFNTCLAAMANARVHMGVDSWTNHATNIKWYDGNFKRPHRIPGVILWGSSQMTATGYPHNFNLHSGIECSPCFKESPHLSKTPLDRCHNPENQSYESPKHKCMELITVEHVLEKVLEMWELKKNRN